MNVPIKQKYQLVQKKGMIFFNVHHFGMHKYKFEVRND